MLKETKKLTALLVMAASIISLTPISVSAAERLESKDGTIDNAMSFSDGKYIYKGYQSDEDDDAIYYNDGNDEAQLEDVEDSDLEFKYGDKYAYAEDSDDQYFINLSNGNVEDDEELEDKAQNVNLKLKTALKKSDRYGKINDVELDKDDILPSNNFSNIWYSYSAIPEADADGQEDVMTMGNEGENGRLYGFTDTEAKYIDVSHLANMYVYSSKRGKMVKVEKYNDEKNDDEVVVRLVEAPQFLTQDEDYIYVKTLVNVEDKNEEPDSIRINEPTTYIQKISKAQGEQEDGGYLPKSVASYEISSLYDSDDADDAYKVLINGDDEYSTHRITDNYYANKGIDTNGAKFAVKDGVFYAIQVNNDNDKVRVTKLKMKKEKLDVDDIDLPSKLDVEIVEKDDDEEQDIANGFDSISVDVDGVIWALDKGKIVKFNDLDAEELYTCDRSISKLDVYDSKNMIAWEGDERGDDGNVFTVIQNGKKPGETVKKDDKKEDENKNTKSGWYKNSDGTWSYYKDNALVKGQWIQDGNWYYLKDDGIMATGWLCTGGNWYYLLKQSGAMATGWIQDEDTTWYYMNPASGEMMTNTVIDGYVLGTNGAWIK